LVNELRLAGITTIEAANRYLRNRFIAAFNREFAHPPRDRQSAFVTTGRADLDQILCHEEERTVAPDCGSSSAATSTARTPSGGAPAASGDSPPKDNRDSFGLWKLPVLWTLDTASTRTLDACSTPQASTVPTRPPLPALSD
jgi:hypothetical protein